MKVSRRRLALALAITPGIGGRTVARVQARNDLLGRTPDEFLQLGEEALREDYRLTAAVAARWRATSGERLDEAARLHDRLDRLGVQLVTTADASYPVRLEQMDPDPPGALYLYGNQRLLEAQTFCVASSRGSDASAHDRIEKLVEEGVLEGETLTTGHDTPEYLRASVVPLRWGAPRVLVLDKGLFRALGDDLTEEPSRPARLWRYQFDPLTDLAVSAQPPFGDYHQNANRVRDRLVGGLSARLDLVSVSPGGNMERVARLALKAGRPVRIGAHSPAAAALLEIGAQPLPN